MFLMSIIKGIAVHGGALRASIASHSNDHRLGANEAPPAIMSVFIGKRLQKSFRGHRKRSGCRKNPKELQMAIELAHLQR